MNNKQSLSLKVIWTLSIDDKVERKDFIEMVINREINSNDLKTKVNKINRMVTKRKDCVRVLLKVDTSNKIDMTKGKSLLQNISNQLGDIGIIRQSTKSKLDKIYEETNELSEEKDKSQESKQKDSVKETGKKVLETSEKEKEVKETYLTLEIIPKTNKNSRQSLSDLLKDIGSVDEIIKKLDETKL